MKSSICAKFKVFIMSGRTPSELIFSAKGGVCFGFLLARDYLGGRSFIQNNKHWFHFHIKQILCLYS